MNAFDKNLRWGGTIVGQKLNIGYHFLNESERSENGGRALKKCKDTFIIKEDK